MPAALARRRNYRGPALFSYGFRPFFLGAALWAMASILLWLPVYFGDFTLPVALAPLDWHIHEMLYGYVPAVVAGFLLTAIPNWTGRLPVNGPPLVMLFTAWLAGRIAMLCSARIGLAGAAAVDMIFLVMLGAFALREVIAGRNWRNLRVVAVLAILIAGNVVFHIEVLRTGVANYGTRIGLAAIVGLIMLIGGRVVPSFTHNWLVRMNPGRLPVSFNRFDGVCLAVAAVALAGWVAVPDHPLVGAALFGAGAMHGLRLARWGGDRTAADRLVLVLHIAYAFIPIGFLLLGAAALWPERVPASAGIHAWTAGAIGLMTLAIMTRATLGHTGRALHASQGTEAIYAFAVAAAVARIVATFAAPVLLLHVAMAAWCIAFAGFAAVYGPMIVKPRLG
jgi:uncharacterized protein involved in response to NO